MFRFYVRLARRAHGLLFRAGNHVLAVLGLIIVAAALLNREWADAIAGWHGFSPWWAVGATFAVFVWLLLRANYDAFTAANGKAETQEATEAKLRSAEQLVELQKQKIAELRRAFAVSQAQYKVFEDFNREQGWKPPVERS